MHLSTDRTVFCPYKYFKNLPSSVQKISRRNFELLKNNPSHPSLHFKKIGKFWSIRIGINYRALAVKDGNNFIWGWIGTHNVYEKMIKEKN